MTEQKLSRETFKFDVFISYRHADLDNAVASYLQKALEHYRVPREIRKKCGKENIQRVFRDEEELGVASDLFSEIEQNLKQSEFLVVICSPRILESKWCQREIETFIKYRGRDNILPVLIEGEPETAFPPILLEHGEPLAADLRGKDKREVLRHARERMPRLAAPLLYCSYDELYQRHRVYKMRRMLAAAGMVTAVSLAFGGVTMMQSREIQRQSGEIRQQNQEIEQRNKEIEQRNRDIQQQNREIQRQSEEIQQRNEEIQQQNREIEQRNEEIEQRNRDIQQQNQEIQRQSEEIQQRNEEIEQRNEEIQQQNQEIRRSYQAKLENQFRYLAKTAAELQDSGDRDAALLVVLEALPRSSEDTSRPYVTEARIALEQALYTYDLSYRYQLRPYKQLEHREEIGSVTDRNTEENVLLTTDAGYLYIWNGAHCENICIQAYSGKLVDARLTGNHRVAVMTETGAWCFDYQTGRVLWQWDYPVCDSGYCSAPDLLWTYDSVSNQLLCANWSFCLHKSDTSGDAEPAAGHMLYLLDAATGESQLWAPAELVDVLKGDPYRSVYLDRRGFALSPGGAWTVLTVDPSFSSSGIVLGVFPTGGDEAVFSKTLTKLSSLTSVMRETVFPDGDHLALLYLTQDGTLLGQSANPSQWQLECWDMRTGEQRLSYQDTCLALDLNVDIQLLAPANGAAEDMVLSVTFDNVAVNLDWSTGERLTRIEDRSTIVLNHYFSTTSELIVTADSYLFLTNPTKDMTWDPVFNAYHYYIGLSRIKKSMWLDGCAYFFTATGVYCYTPPVDDSYTSLAATPNDVFFTADSKGLLAGCKNDRIYFYDTEDFSLLWEDEYYSSYSNRTFALLDDRLAAWLTGDGTVVKVRSLSDGSVREVQLDGFTADLAGNIYWNLRPAGGGKVLVWNSGYNSFYQNNMDKLDDTILWLVDGDRGEVTARWSYRDILWHVPDVYYLNALTLYVEWPAATADSRYVLVPCRLRGNIDAGSGQKEQKEAPYVLIWDMETGETVEISSRVTQGLERELMLGYYFQQDGWISPTEPAAVFYNSGRKALQVVDLTSGEVLRELEVDGIASREVSFTPDGDHLIFQDPQRRLCVYNWKTGEYTMHNTTSEVGYMSFSFHQDGQVLCAPYKAGGLTSETSLIYRRTGDGVYKQETVMSRCGDCDGRTVVINDSDYPRLYRAYTLDDLIAMAKEILNGRELTELERKSYLID